MANTHGDNVLADGPVAFWRMEEESGTAMADETANSHDGTYVNAPTLNVTSATSTTGVGTGYDGVDQHSIVPSHADLSGWADFSIEFLIRVQTWPAGSALEHVLSVYSGTTDRSWTVQLAGPDAGAVLRLLLSADGTPMTTVVVSGIDQADLDDGAWHHVVIVRDGSTVTFYLDGTSAGSATNSNTLNASALDLAIGGLSDASAFSHVDMDEVALFGKALTLTQVESHHDTAMNEPPPPLSAGTISLVSKSHDEVKLSATDASGGTTPYSYQWHRSTTQGFTPGAGNALAGATSLSLTDSTVAAETTYYYVLVYTDDDGSTADSNELEVTTDAEPAPAPATDPIIRNRVLAGKRRPYHMLGRR